MGYLMRLNRNIVEEALGLPSEPWSPETDTNRSLTHAETFGKGSWRPDDNQTLWVIDYATFKSLKEIRPPENRIVVATSPEEVNEADRGKILVDEGGVQSVMNRVSQVFATYFEWSDRLSKATIRPNPLASLVEITQDGMGYPIVLFGLDCTILAISSMRFVRDSDLWRSVDELGFMPMDIQMKDNMDLSFVHDSTHGRITQGIYRSDPNNCYLDAAVMHQGKVYAWLSAVGPLEGFSVGSASLLRHARHKFEDALVIKGGDRQERRQVVGLVRDLLSGEDIPQKVVNVKMSRWASPEKDRFMLFLFAFDRSIDDPEVRIPMLTSNISSIFPDSIVIERYETVAMVNKVTGDGRRERILRNVELMSRSMRCHAIYSSVLGELTLIQGCYQQMNEVVRFIDMEGRPPLVSFEELYDQYAASSLLSLYPFEEIGHPFVVELARRGNPGDVDLITCLMTFLDNERSALAASKVLFIHRNTVLYRIGKIEEELGQKLGDMSPGERLHLLLSCKMALHEMRRQE